MPPQDETYICMAWWVSNHTGVISWDLYIYAPHSVDALDVDPGHTCSAGDRMYGVLEGIPIMQSVEKVCRSSHEDK